MNRQLLLRTSTVFALCLIAAACSDDDDSETGTGDLNTAGSEMGAAGNGMGGGGMGSDDATAMSFFVTSGPGPDGGNFGGLTGADEFCSSLATAAGSTGKTWRAMLSTDDVDAMTRIGAGPWYNAAGVMFAADVASLFENGIVIGPTGDDFDAATDPKRALLLDESGAPVLEDPNEHDILTGSNPDGTAAATNCLNWTSGAAEDTAQVGHSDSRGPQGDNTRSGWLSSHASRGCDLASFNSSGGAGRIYCFAE